MAEMTDVAEKALLDYFFNDTVFGPITPHLAWFSTQPTDAGGGTEVSALARTSHTYNAASSRQTANAAQIDVPTSGTGLTSQSIPYVAIFDAATAGNMLCYATLDTALTVSDPDPIRVPAGGMVWDFPDGTAGNEALSNYLVNSWLDLLFGTATPTRPSSWTVELHTDDPGPDGLLNKFSGGGYTPAAATWDATDTVTTQTRTKNSGQLNWLNLQQNPVSWWSVFDNASNFLARNDQADTTITPGSNATAAAGALQILVG